MPRLLGSLVFTLLPLISACTAEPLQHAQEPVRPTAPTTPDAQEPTSPATPWTSRGSGLSPQSPLPVEGGPDAEEPHPTFDECFAAITSDTGASPDYAPFAPVIGEHCAGTNHQDVTGIERVVFLGDSVTVGTPPTDSSESYRSLLADRLAERFGLEAPSGLWRSYNAVSGTALLQHSGDFWSCAKWGARTDDLLEDNSQILDCFPAEERAKRTLVVMTMGGNDIAAFTKDGANGTPVAEVTEDVADIVQKLRDAVVYLKDPAVFPGGVDVIFTNNFEFTDATGDVASCAAASAAGFDRSWEDPRALANLVVWMMEQYMAIAVETHSDLVFVLESFCGHGFHHDDPDNGCYRGPDAERWFDLTCIHPNPTGHAVLADMFMAIVDE